MWKANMPQFQLPELSNLPDYQQYPMVRRFSQLVPHRAPLRTGHGLTDSLVPLCESNWLRDWFPNTTNRPSVDEPPPAYDDIVRSNPDFNLDLKKTSVVTAAADALADQKCVEVYDVSTEAESSSTVTQGKAAEQQKQQKLEVKLGKTSLTREQQEQLRLKRGKNLEKRDLGLYLFYVSHSSLLTAASRKLTSTR